MSTDTGIYELALGEGDQYAAIFANILNSIDDTFDGDIDDDFIIEDPDF